MAWLFAKIANQGLPPIPATTMVAINLKETRWRIIHNKRNHASTIEDIAVGNIRLLADPFDRPVGLQGNLDRIIRPLKGEIKNMHDVWRRTTPLNSAPEVKELNLLRRLGLLESSR